MKGQSIKPVITVLLSLFFVAAAHAQADSTLHDTISIKRHWWQPDSLVNKKLSWLPIPGISSSPETGLRFGLVLQYFLNTSTGKDSTKKARDSYAYIEGLYSTRKQTTIESYTQLFTAGEKYFIRNRIGYSDNNERLWGFGNHTVAADAYELVRYSRWYWQASVARQVRNHFFAGINFNLSRTYNVRGEIKDSNLLYQQPGEFGSGIVGAGPTLVWDKRDHPLSPHTGWYGELAATFYARVLGAGYAYSEYHADFRKYVQLHDNSVLAFQGWGSFTGGTVPWREQPRLGNSMIMRGYFGGRFRDNQYAAVQTEYRKPVHRLVTLAVFASAGEVQHTVGDFNFSDLRAAAGGGVRLLINKAKQVAVRIDYARSTDHTSGFYFKIGEAF
ncbi:BamA/TamA family outer membrane protein [Deminuibacter soli]|uniref:BamA/TamA family outer membrane protein n=1 Tax=Deminuibacter soli TaxID=2291815 RepID=UPI001314A95F|nr:BamA/TamA family outer membrane protein [Deminuibacter soli]